MRKLRLIDNDTGNNVNNSTINIGIIIITRIVVPRIKIIQVIQITSILSFLLLVMMHRDSA